MSASTVPLALLSKLEALKKTGAHRFDPVRFCYIEALANRATDKRDPVADKIRERAFEALAEYQATFARAQKDAENIAATATSRSPESADQLEQLVADCDFRSLKRLQVRLAYSADPGTLASLLDKLAKGEPGADSSAEELSLDEILRQQEEQLLKPCDGSVDRAATTAAELRSVRHFRESLEKLNTDKLVKQATDEVSGDFGPLNSQRLVIRSLIAMGDLSPQYLNRYVTYLDTLLWLEQAGENS